MQASLVYTRRLVRIRYAGRAPTLRRYRPEYMQTQQFHDLVNTEINFSVGKLRTTMY